MNRVFPVQAEGKVKGNELRQLVTYLTEVDSEAETALCLFLSSDNELRSGAVLFRNSNFEIRNRDYEGKPSFHE